MKYEDLLKLLMQARGEVIRIETLKSQKGGLTSRNNLLKASALNKIDKVLSELFVLQLKDKP